MQQRLRALRMAICHKARCAAQRLQHHGDVHALAARRIAHSPCPVGRPDAKAVQLNCPVDARTQADHGDHIRSSSKAGSQMLREPAEYV